METYKFPKRGELRSLITKVWPEKSHKDLVEQVLSYAGCEILPDGLPSYLALAIEIYCTGRSSELAKACYATMAPVIRVLMPDKTQRNLALNEYVSLLERLSQLEH